jgi:hypothetical protein
MVGSLESLSENDTNKFNYSRFDDALFIDAGVNSVMSNKQ